MKWQHWNIHSNENSMLGKKQEWERAIQPIKKRHHPHRHHDRRPHHITSHRSEEQITGIEITAWQTAITSEKCLVFLKQREQKTRRATYWNVKRIVDFYPTVKMWNNIYPKWKKNQRKQEKARVYFFVCSSCLWHNIVYMSEYFF